MTTRWSESGGRRADGYDDRWRALEAEGKAIHGEADFVARWEPATVLDAGCGTGRVALELHRRGIEVVGVDADPAMLAVAREKAPDLPWLDADLARLDLRDAVGSPRTFDLIVLAGNVMIFLAPGTEGEVLQRLAAHLPPGGTLVAGFQLGGSRLTLDRYDELAAAAGLHLAERYGTWERAPFEPGGDYAVSVSTLRRDP